MSDLRQNKEELDCSGCSVQVSDGLVARKRKLVPRGLSGTLRERRRTESAVSILQAPKDCLCYRPLVAVS
jgi:hypothetical protein